jgi:hypothetical protein
MNHNFKPGINNMFSIIVVIVLNAFYIEIYLNNIFIYFLNFIFDINTSK